MTAPRTPTKRLMVALWALCSQGGGQFPGNPWKPVDKWLKCLIVQAAPLHGVGRFLHKTPSIFHGFWFLFVDRFSGSLAHYLSISLFLLRKEEEEEKGGQKCQSTKKGAAQKSVHGFHHRKVPFSWMLAENYHKRNQALNLLRTRRPRSTGKNALGGQK